MDSGGAEMIANWGLGEWLLLWGVLSIVPTAAIAVAMYMAGRD